MEKKSAIWENDCLAQNSEIKICKISYGAA